MKDMSIIANKKIVNKETNEVRQVVQIDEENRKIYSVPVNEPDAEPTAMAAASYDRRWTLYEEPTVEAAPEAADDDLLGDEDDDLLGPDEAPSAETETPAEEPETPAETETPAEDKPEEPKKPRAKKADEPVDPAEAMRMSETIKSLEDIFDKLNVIYFEGKLPKPVITVQTTPKAYGHCSTKKIWKSENEGMYEINLGAEFINRPKEQTCCTLLHEMVHLFCNENDIRDTCQNGRYHNKAFATECEARDMVVEYDRANGYAHTSPTDAFKQKIAEAGIDLTVRFARIMPKAKAKAERQKAHRYICPICGQEVRSTSELSLICGVCEVPMTCED